MDIEDKKKLEEMYLKFQYVLKKIAYLSEIPSDYINDVVHDIFISYACYDYSPDLPSENLKMLLIKILKSRCMSYHRRMRRRSYEELNEETYNTEDFPSHDKVANLSDFVVSKERCQVPSVEIEKMPENWRQVAALRLIGGRSVKEVCEILSITGRARYSRVDRIRKYLETLLQDENWP